MKTKKLEIKKRTIVNLEQAVLKLAKGGTGNSENLCHTMYWCDNTDVCTTNNPDIMCFACNQC